MRRSASEIINNLEMRVARLEKQSRLWSLGYVLDKIEKNYNIQFTTNLRSKALREKVTEPDQRDLEYRIKNGYTIKIVNRDGEYWELRWQG